MKKEIADLGIPNGKVIKIERKVIDIQPHLKTYVVDSSKKHYYLSTPDIDKQPEEMIRFLTDTDFDCNYEKVGTTDKGLTIIRHTLKRSQQTI
jgi:hypothetical protein